MDVEMVSPEVEEELALSFEDQQLLAESSADEDHSEQQRLLASSSADVEQGFVVVEEEDTSGLEAKHSIFLSHSGAQKDFVEQLCEDLERAELSPFFDKRPESLPKGEMFARYIFRAAQQCELAIVVVSEEYFSRGKWPMLELSALVKSKKCKILPLFYKLSDKEFGDPERRQRWYRKWHEWAQADPRIRVEDWKTAVRELDGRNGLVYPEALGEVYYRRDVVATAHAIMQKVTELRQLEITIPAKDNLVSKILSYVLKGVGAIVAFIFVAIIYYLLLVVLRRWGTTIPAKYRLVPKILFFVLKGVGAVVAYIIVASILMLIFFRILVPIFLYIIPKPRGLQRPHV